MAEPYDLEKLQAYVEGEMPEAERSAYERETLAADAGLRELAEDLKSDKALLRRLPDEPPGRELLPEATERAERALLLGEPDTAPAGRIAPDRRRHAWTRRLVYTGVAAAVLLAAGLTMYSVWWGLEVNELGDWSDGPVATRTNERESEAAGNGRAEPDRALAEALPSDATSDADDDPAASPLAKADARSPTEGREQAGEAAAAEAEAAEPPVDSSPPALARAEAVDADGDLRPQRRRESAELRLGEQRLAGRVDASGDEAAASDGAEARAGATADGGVLHRPMRGRIAASRVVRATSANPIEARVRLVEAARRAGIEVIEAVEDRPGVAVELGRAAGSSDAAAAVRVTLIGEPAAVRRLVTDVEAMSHDATRRGFSPPRSRVESPDAEPRSAPARRGEDEAAADMDWAGVLLDALPAMPVEPVTGEAANRRVTVIIEPESSPEPADATPAVEPAVEPAAEPAGADTDADSDTSPDDAP